MNNILITGCTHGLGKALALCFEENDFKVYAVARDNKLLNETFKTNDNITPICADVSDENGRKMICDALKGVKLSSIIHNAAMATPAQIENITTDLLLQHFKTNFVAPIMLTKNLLPNLVQGSKVLNISSLAADLTMPGLMPYCTSKKALEHAANCLNVELKDKEIHFANFRPGLVDTNMQKNLRESNEADLPGKNLYIQVQKEGKLQKPEAVAELVYKVIMNTEIGQFKSTLWDIALANEIR